MEITASAEALWSFFNLAQCPLECPQPGRARAIVLQKAVETVRSTEGNSDLTGRPREWTPPLTEAFRAGQTAGVELLE